MKSEQSEERESLWWLALSPSVWMLHLLASYITAALWCAKLAGRAGALGGARTAIAVYTAVALVAIGLVALHAFRRHTYDNTTVPHDFDTRDSRYRFIGFATLLLSLLSAVGVVYVALAALVVESCR